MLVLAPPGVNLDTPWLAEIGVKNRDLPDRGNVTGEELFISAKTLATRHTVEWLTNLAEIMRRAGLSAFWDRLMKEPRTGARSTFTDLEMEKAFLRRLRQRPGPFRRAGASSTRLLDRRRLSPEPDGSDEGWFLGLDIGPPRTRSRVPNADIFADVEGKSFLLDRMHGRSAAGGVGEMRILEHNDCEAGAKDTYVLGPFADSWGNWPLPTPSKAVARCREHCAEIGIFETVFYTGIASALGLERLAAFEDSARLRAPR